MFYSCNESEYACLGNWNGRYVSGWKNDSLFIGDLVVLEKQDEFHIYEFAGVSGNEFVFMALDSKVENIKQHNGQAYHWLEQ